MKKAELIQATTNKDRVHGFYLENLEATRGDIAIYQMGVQVYAPDWDAENETWTKEFTERHTLKMVVYKENTPQEDARWEKTKMQHTEWPAPPSSEPAAPTFQQKMKLTEKALKDNGMLLGAIEKAISTVGTAAIVEARIPDPDDPTNRLKDYEVNFFVTEDKDGNIAYSPWKAEDKTKEAEIRAKREALQGS